MDQAASAILRQIIEERACTQEGMAAVLGITQASVSRRLSSSFDRWTLGELEALSRWLKVDLIGMARKAAQS